MSRFWYTLRSKPRKESALCLQVRARSIEVFFPQHRVKPVNPRSRKFRPYFPGYMFVYIDIDEAGISMFRWMPYAVGLVTFGGEAATVPEALIEKIRHHVDLLNTGQLKVSDAFQHGERIQVIEGPFEGYEGIFDTTISGTERVRLLLGLMRGTSFKVEMDVDNIQKMSRR